MRAALVAETRKVLTTRMWWILLVVMAAYMALMSGGLAAALSLAPEQTGAGTDAPPIGPEQVVRGAYTVAVSFGYLFPLLIGAMVVTSEFRHKTITPTLLAEPRRTVVLVAKLGAGAVLGVVFGVVGTLASVGAGAGVLAIIGKPTYLDLGSTWRTIALSALALTVWAVLGVGFGATITNQVAVIVVVLAFTQFVEPVARFALASTDWGGGIAKFLPGAAGEAISGGSFYSVSGLGDLLAWWQGLLVLLGYALVLAVVGRLTTLRRDIT